MKWIQLLLRRLTAAPVLLLLCVNATAAPDEHRFDVVVYGATPSGIAAAVNAARMGVKVGLFEESSRIGGIVASGMSNTDFKTFEAVQGTYREFMNRIVKYYASRYGDSSQQVKDCYHGGWYEPRAALAVFQQMLNEQPNVKLFTGYRLTAVNKQAGRIATLLFNTGSATVSVQAIVSIDATYEGDLMAASGASWTIGRESRQQYGELFAGKLYHDGMRFLPGSSGEADRRIQCSNFRICMTTDAKNRVAITKPDVYNRNEYLSLLPNMRSADGAAVLDSIVKFRYIPNGKADVNDLLFSPKSLRLEGENYGWPEGDQAVRNAIYKRHKDYSLGLFYFLQHDNEVPAHVRREALCWGLPADEFEESGNFPPKLYLREGRRLTGTFVLTENDTQPSDSSVRSPLYKDAVAVCDYSMDSHGVSPADAHHPDVSEGVFNYYIQPFQIPYRCLLPQKVDGLLVPVALSASHVAFSAVRMEPAWTALGQAAGMAAAMAVKEKQSVDKINVTALQQQLYNDGAITVYFSDVLPGSPYFKAAQYLGTQGYFHYLPEYRTASYASRGKTVKGQWLYAYKNHAVSPDIRMDDELLDQWLNKAGLTKMKSASLLNMSRGECMLWLYNQLYKAKS